MAQALTKQVPFDAEFVSRASEGELIGGGRAHGISTDTRQDVEGSLFVAIQGDTHDGHAHVDAALAGGARGALVARRDAVALDALEDGQFVVVVDDTRRALGRLAHAWRHECEHTSFVGITGSCGKTSTKVIADWILGGAPRVLASEKSYNNDIGVPLTLLRAREDSEVVLVEIGTNGPGEIEALTQMAQPDIALVTMIGRGHLEGLGDLEGVFEEKRMILEHSKRSATSILNADDAMFRRLVEAAGPRRVVSYGINHAADVRATSLRPVGDFGISFELVVDPSFASDAATHETVTLPRPGIHDVRNTLAALTIGLESGWSLESMLARVAELPSPPRRLEVKLSRSGRVRILDDTYNANPESLLVALSVLDRTRDAQRRILVLGDMRELGDQQIEIHEEAGEAAVGRVDVFVSVGELAAHGARAFREHGGAISIEFPDVDALIADLQAIFGNGDLVLFKGSRVVSLDRAVDALVNDKTSNPA